MIERVVSINQAREAVTLWDAAKVCRERAFYEDAFRDGWEMRAEKWTHLATLIEDAADQLLKGQVAPNEAQKGEGW